MADVGDLRNGQRVHFNEEEFTLKHVTFLTADNSVEFLGRTIKRLQRANMTMEFPQRFIDELLGLCEITGKVTTTGFNLRPVPEDQMSQCDKVVCQKFRTEVGIVDGSAPR